MLTGNLNAARFAQRPLPQPTYTFADVPKADRDLSGSALQFIDNDRDAFHCCMAEMLLLCKEALRRRKDMGSLLKTSGGSKPLSLEYLADRCDVDDPLFGFVIRTAENPCPLRNRRWKAGMLQGFITVTTFTNYQKTFQWNSRNEIAFSYDDEELAMQRSNGERVWDVDGTLADELQSTVRCGDVWNEGIVWPRIAEISLLGGLGCGRALVSLVVEHLEGLKATGKCNYDYVVLQATDNSISFYESMGFVRVGAIAKEENHSASKHRPSTSSAASSSSTTAAATTSDEDDIVAEPIPDNSPEKPNAIARSCDIVSSEVTAYTCTRAGETIAEVAKKNDVDAWDIIFLNKYRYPNMVPSSKLLADTVLHIPVVKKPESNPARPKSQQNTEAPQWYVAKENETPKTIARKLNLSCLDLVKANKGRLAGLMSSSRLKSGTRIKISHLEHFEEGEYQAYAHWSFPDDQFEDGEPSYMMARKLNRRRGRASSIQPYLETLTVPISKYEPTELVVAPSPHPHDRLGAGSAAAATAAGSSAAEASSKPVPPKARKRLAAAATNNSNEPKPPKRPLNSYMVFIAEQREKLRNEHDSTDMNMLGATKTIAEAWNVMTDEEKQPYEKQSQISREKYAVARKKYQKELEAYRRTYGITTSSDSSVTESEVSNSKKKKKAAASTKDGAVKNTLYNKVVRLKPGAMTEGSDFTYWYVLTFIPDLKWCHLAPMIEVGTFDDDKGKSKGRPKWVLLDESHGKEVDISSSFCIPIKARALRKTLDADKEEWDVIGTEELPTATATTTARAHTPSIIVRGAQYDSDDIQFNNKTNPRPARKSTATKPSAERKRKYSTSDIPRLLAAHPRTKQITYVRLTGHRLYDANFSYPVRRKIGRPRGSLGSKKKARLQETSGDDSSNSSSVGKKRGRPKGSKNKAKSPPSSDGAVAHKANASKKRGRPSNDVYEPSDITSSARRRGIGGRSVSVPASARKKWACSKSSIEPRKPKERRFDDATPKTTRRGRSLERARKNSHNAPLSRRGRSLERSCKSNSNSAPNSLPRRPTRTTPRRAAATQPLLQAKHVVVRVGGRIFGTVEGESSDSEESHDSSSECSYDDVSSSCSTPAKKFDTNDGRLMLLRGKIVCRRCHNQDFNKKGHAWSCPLSSHYQQGTDQKPKKTSSTPKQQSRLTKKRTREEEDDDDDESSDSESSYDDVSSSCSAPAKKFDTNDGRLMLLRGKIVCRRCHNQDDKNKKGHAWSCPLSSHYQKDDDQSVEGESSSDSEESHETSSDESSDDDNDDDDVLSCSTPAKKLDTNDGRLMLLRGKIVCRRCHNQDTNKKGHAWSCPLSSHYQKKDSCQKPRKTNSSTPKQPPRSTKRKTCNSSGRGGPRKRRRVNYDVGMYKE